MRTIIILLFGLMVFSGTASAQVGSSISSDGTTPNINAMLDVQSPAVGDGKGMLIPRVTANQRTNANASLAGGLLDGSGNLRGGAAQGLIVYQTDGVQGLYFNTSLTAIPVWMYLGGDSNSVSVGCQANGYNVGVAVGASANSIDGGSAMGYQAKGTNFGTAIGRQANGCRYGAAIGYQANGYFNGAALGIGATGTYYGVAAGYYANGDDSGVAMGRSANGNFYGVAAGREANGYSQGAALGWEANGNASGAAVGHQARGYSAGAAVGDNASGYYEGAALGYLAVGYSNGAAVGSQANGSIEGAALGYLAKGYDSGVAVGRSANGTHTNVAIGFRANAQGGTQRIAIGNNVTNQLDNTAAIRGTLYLDGGTGVMYRANFGSGTVWTVKAFTIDHPLDPANKVLRHFCLEGPQVWNVYAGNAQLVNGRAIVQLPDYYSALNLVGSEIYSLTPISSDRRATAVIEQEVINNSFVIGGSSDMKVSWTIKVLRNDPGCLEDLRRRPVEQRKDEFEIGN